MVLTILERRWLNESSMVYGFLGLTDRRLKGLSEDGGRAAPAVAAPERAGLGERF